MAEKSIDDLSRATAYDSDNEKLGAVKEVYINDDTGQPDFIEVGHGLFGMNSSLVPLRGHTLQEQDLHLSFTKDRIKDAPDLNADEHLDPEQLEALYRHYGLENTQNTENYAGVADDPRDPGDIARDPADHAAAENRSAGPGTAGTAGAAGAAGVAGAAGAAGTANDPADHAAAENRSAAPGTAGTAGTAGGVDPVANPDAPDPVADPAAYAAQSPVDRVTNPDDAPTTAGRTADDGELTRSEEQLHVEKDRQASGKVRLRKHVVHDTKNVEVPVEHEEVRVERTPVDPDEATPARDDLSKDETSVTVHEDRVNVSKDSVPVEKVKLEKDTVQDTETVSEDLAREEIETEGLDDADTTIDRDPRDPRDR